MHPTEKFWATIWSIIGATLIGFSMVVSGCSNKEAEIEANILTSGADPMLIRCSRVSRDTDATVALLCAKYVEEKK